MFQSEAFSGRSTGHQDGTTAGGEAHLKRAVDTVAIPVFQFGMFSDVDLSFHAGANFNFGGRIHTNGNLYLAQGGGAGS
mgnify:CR=1 FL=1